MTDYSKKILEADSVRGLPNNQRGPIKNALKTIESPAFKTFQDHQVNQAISRIIADIDRNKPLVRNLQGLMDELQKSGVFARAPKYIEQLAPALAAIESYNARFSVPKIKVAEDFINLQMPLIDPKILNRFALKSNEIQRAVQSIRTPWLDEQNPQRSARSFIELQGIGNMLSRLPSFDDTINTTLRSYLGDWRDAITWPEPVLTDLNFREKFYVELGFDTSLTDFPEATFRESTEIAGLRNEPPALVDTYGEPFPHTDDGEEEGALTRTNMAHNWLMRLETNVRQFIDAQMTAAFGENWPKHRLPNGIYDQWMSKREAADKAGRATLPLVAYADFTDYVLVICKTDNWREVFNQHFDRSESVRESFQRLHPIRLDTMHARPIGQDDELLLYVEVKRLMRVTRM